MNFTRRKSRVWLLLLAFCVCVPAFPESIADLANGNHSFRELGDSFLVNTPIKPIEGAKLVLFNEEAAKRLGISLPVDKSELEKQILKQFAFLLAGQGEAADRHMFATYYQDSDSRQPGEARGDGRAVWTGELQIHGSDGKIYYVDIVAKGVGATPLAWTSHGDPLHSDGLQSMGEAVHSYIHSEANFRNGIDSTVDLAVIEIPILRPKESGGSEKAAITVRVGNQTRIAHLRYFRDRPDKFKQLYSYILRRDLGLPLNHEITRDLVQKHFAQFTDNLAEEAARYYDLNAVHGSPTTGNRTTRGATIDMGTFRYIDAFHAEYSYLYGQRTLGGSPDQTAQFKSYLEDLQSYFKEAGFTPAPGETSLKNLDRRFEQKFRKRMTSLSLHRLGLSPEEAAALPLPLKNAFFQAVNALYLAQGEKDIQTPEGRVSPAAFDTRKILGGTALLLADPGGDDSRWLKLFRPDRSWASLDDGLMKPYIENYKKALSAILEKLAPSNSRIQEWAARAALLSTNRRNELGEHYSPRRDRAITGAAMDAIKEGKDFAEISRLADQAVAKLVDEGTQPRFSVNLGPSNRCHWDTLAGAASK